MSEAIRHLVPAIAVGLAILSAGCGQTGKLYLPAPAGEVVTRPTQTPPPEVSEGSANSPSADSPSAPDTPAPEVTAPGDAQPRKKNDTSTPGPGRKD
jgi:predicted small lipoprotein YifL